MHLAGRLKATTLGDLLGALFRGGASGTLELREPNGRIHRVHLTGGLVLAVEIDRASLSLADLLRRHEHVDEDILRRSLLRAMASRRLHGEVLVRDFRLAPEVVDRALRRQLSLRLAALDELPDAQICFRVAVRPPRGALEQPLATDDFLAGKKRARDRRATPSGTFQGPSAGWSRPSWTSAATAPAEGRGRMNAYRALGVPFGAGADDVKRAYRRLVRAYHPDLHPEASTDERRSLSERFAEVTAAYRALVA